MKVTQAFVGVLMMTTGIDGIADAQDDFVEVPGDDEYSIRFEVDWSVFDSGTFSYGPEGSTVRDIGGGRGAYGAFFNLTLDFSFKDGRRYGEVIDVKEYVRQLAATVEVFGNRDTDWNVFATLVIQIEKNELALIYRVSEQILEPDYEHRHHYYPLYRKTLN